MASFREGGGPSSPVDEILKNMNLTREDLARHSEQMRLFLTGGADCASSSTFAPQPIQPPKQSSRSRKLSSRAVSRSNSLVNNLARAASPSPSRVHVKPEPVEDVLPTRTPNTMSTMELVLERKSKQSRERRSSNARSRDGRRAQDVAVSTPSTDMTPQSTPRTPHHYRHYSERVLGDAFASRAALHPSGASDPRTPRTQSQAPGSSRAATPAGRTIYSRGISPQRAPSPGSSPTRVVNMVSSPGPMRSSPAPEAKEDKLPYVLPPGPYFEEKPDVAYAGLIGQAILSSPGHRLTLQDIYEWITTVYPYYKRGEQTWMNSVRHCLSTMAVFRKVTRVRNEGKSLWAILDEDVPAFANGSFKKALCADMAKQDKEKQTKRGQRKRGAAMDGGRDTKRHKGEHAVDEGTRLSTCHPMLPPYLPPFHVTPNQQPYFQTYAPQAIPAEVLFPPLPPNIGLGRSTSRPMSARPMSAAGSSATRPVSAAGSLATELSMPRGRDRSPKHISSASSMPALTPNCSSSSSPPLSSHASLADDPRYSSSPAMIAVADSDEDEESELEVGWLRRGPPVEALAPSATLLKPADFSSSGRSRSQRDARKRYKALSARPAPESPTLEHRPLLGKHQEVSRRDPSTPPPESTQLLPLPSTPPNRLCTPPRRQRVTSSGIRLSPTLTPISHAGLHMSPSPSLAHYKSHLDPPPPASMHFPQAPLLAVPTSSQMTPPRSTGSNVDVHTPLRKVSGTSDPFNLSPFAPVTPQRLTYPSFDSPWRTPSRNIYDPHAPSSILDDELYRQSLKDISPSLLGLSGRPRGLWDSPLGSSPSVDRFWG
ncbi:hypothetical protein DAEQUDRAFT_769192 [Daedalea quercina L-15889]|uniref:Fork-head domain-containing protein n=1 Tax=Daedalea quercina L-15889 TaxID=1314783 RepID=A0A165LZA2_9APHY|nr:hypothetical protein DAEQUDRAFT_769192 [Daedalea quercina L-15889]